MYRALGNFIETDGHTDLSFREPERWASMSTGTASRVANVKLHTTSVLLGDEVSGPVLLLLHLGPDVHPPDAPAHGHASDTWRMSLLGTLPMGPDSYDAGEFRFQQGWKPYASDNYAKGPEGGWTALVFGDRRGMRVRHVKEHGPAITDTDRALAAWIGIEGDLVSEDPAAAPGPSSLVTTLDDVRTGARINGSFHEADGWLDIDGIRVAAGAMGDAVSGPLVLLAKVPAGGTSLSGLTLDADVLRMVVRGSHVIDGVAYEAGDIRVQAAGVPFNEAVAGPDGVDEVIVIADRRGVGGSGDDPWRHVLSTVLDDLGQRRPASRGAA